LDGVVEDYNRTPKQKEGLSPHELFFGQAPPPSTTLTAVEAAALQAAAPVQVSLPAEGRRRWREKRVLEIQKGVLNRRDTLWKKKYGGKQGDFKIGQWVLLRRQRKTGFSKKRRLQAVLGCVSEVSESGCKLIVEQATQAEKNKVWPFGMLQKVLGGHSVIEKVKKVLEEEEQQNSSNGSKCVVVIEKCQL